MAVIIIVGKCKCICDQKTPRPSNKCFLFSATVSAVISDIVVYAVYKVMVYDKCNKFKV